MFKFLKEKLKNAVSSITKKVEEEAEEATRPATEQTEEPEITKEGTGKGKAEVRKTKSRALKEKKESETAKKKERKKGKGKKGEADKNKEAEEVDKKEEEENNVTTEEKEEKRKSEKKSLFSRLKKTIITKKLSAEQFDDIFWELELALLENNVAVEVIEKIKDTLKEKLVDRPIKKSEMEQTIISALQESLKDILSFEETDFIEKIKSKKPYVICFLGVNGSGKTTSIAKIAWLLQKEGLAPVIAAADTFRAAAIDQLEEHAQKLGVKIIKHQYGSDAAAVAYDAIEHAKSKNKDVVLIDTAGRMHSNKDLIDELRKIVRVTHPDMKIFVGESITGNDCVEQAKKFDEAVGIDGIILTKADIDEKGGAPLSISYVTKKPIIFIGTGQNYEDLKKFNPESIMKALGF